MFIMAGLGRPSTRALERFLLISGRCKDVPSDPGLRVMTKDNCNDAIYLVNIVIKVV